MKNVQRSVNFIDYKEISDDIDDLIKNHNSIKGNEKVIIAEEDEDGLIALCAFTGKREAYILLEIDKNEAIHSGHICREIKKYPNFQKAEWLDVKGSKSLKQNYISALEEFHVKVIVK